MSYLIGPTKSLVRTALQFKATAGRSMTSMGKEGEGSERRVPEGHVPVLVGVEKEMERFVVQLELFNHPSLMDLLERTAQEFGYKQEGVLRIACEADHFKNVLEVISRGSK